MKRQCAFKGCKNKQHTAGFCQRHYKIMMRDCPEKVVTINRMSSEKKLEWVKEHAGYEGDDCLIVPWFVSEGSYSPMDYCGKRVTIMSVMCFIAHGQRPSPSAAAYSICENARSGCVNPNHLKWSERWRHKQKSFWRSAEARNYSRKVADPW